VVAAALWSCVVELHGGDAALASIVRHSGAPQRLANGGLADQRTQLARRRSRS
jgi:hypothetical protein